MRLAKAPVLLWASPVRLARRKPAKRRWSPLDKILLQLTRLRRLLLLTMMLSFLLLVTVLQLTRLPSLAHLAMLCPLSRP